MVDSNPYAAPTEIDSVLDDELILEPGDRKKIEAIVKDARQFWLAIFLCLLCSAIGAIIIPIWYTIRLLQWNKYAGKYPELRYTNGRPGSLAIRFQSSQWRLIVGIAFGALIFLMVGAYFFFALSYTVLPAD